MLQSCQKYVQFTASCLNIHENMRFTDEGTALVAFLPSIKEGHNMGNDKKKIVIRKRALFHQCLEKLFEGFIVYMERGMTIRCFDGEIRTVKPFLSAYLADMLEHYSVCLNVDGSCNYCEATKSDLGNENVSKPIRTNEDSRNKYEGVLSVRTICL